MKYDIFISYRRKDSSGRSNVTTARMYKQAFEKPPFKYKVFLDQDGCKDNYFFEGIVVPAIKTCDFFVLVLTKDSLKRCEDEGDWVRKEIEEALASNKKIISITTDNECDTWPNLPDSLSKLKGLQITSIHTDGMFEKSIEELMKNRFQNDEDANDEDPIKIEEPANGKMLEKIRILKEKAKHKVKETSNWLKSNKNLIIVFGVFIFVVFMLIAWHNKNRYNGYKYVDLGLPSGLLWATCNVGSTSPEGYGYYYAWGETELKTEFYLNNYRSDITDSLKILRPEDDAATDSWGANWRMPTKQECQELYQNTTHEWKIQKGVVGLLFTASNGKSLFFPAAGYRSGDERYDEGYTYRGRREDYYGGIGYYWSSSLGTGDTNKAWCFNVTLEHMEIRERYIGCSIRAVYSKSRK